MLAGPTRCRPDPGGPTSASVRERGRQTGRRTGGRRGSPASPGAVLGEGDPEQMRGRQGPSRARWHLPAPARRGTWCRKGLPSLFQPLPGSREHQSAQDPPTTGGFRGSCSHRQREQGCQSPALVMTSRGQWALRRGPERSSLRDSGVPRRRQSGLLGPADATRRHGAGGCRGRAVSKAVTVL